MVRAPPKMMALTRASARTRGKSDPIDALWVARAFLREPGLPVVSHDEVSRELKLLVDRREPWWRKGQRRSTASSGGSMSSILTGIETSVTGPGQHQNPLRERLWTQSALVAELALDELGDIVALTARAKCWNVGST